ncbi:hypothetical protein RIF29_26376 [Crotalaria pallida]|uniref:Ribonuclease H1 N-terminal domain-containing protein n=1 Tax=Crotalaria pallida TaxID=3830 RepID=A0AAN9I1N4_CROPI
MHGKSTSTMVGTILVGQVFTWVTSVITIQLKNRDIENQLYEFSMQDTLAKISHLHTKLFPAYTKHSVMAQGVKNYVRYYCYMQVTGYSRASYEAFDTFEEAKESWDSHVAAQLTGSVPVHGDGGGEASSSSPVVGGSSDDGGVGALPNIVNDANLEAFLIGLMVGLAMTLKK